MLLPREIWLMILAINKKRWIKEKWTPFKKQISSKLEKELRIFPSHHIWGNFWTTARVGRTTCKYYGKGGYVVHKTDLAYNKVLKTKIYLKSSLVRTKVHIFMGFKDHRKLFLVLDLC